MSVICKHDQLARQCPLCELETELAIVTAERDKLRRRIEMAPAVLVSSLPGTNSGFGFVATDGCMVGKRVALVEIE